MKKAPFRFKKAIGNEHSLNSTEKQRLVSQKDLSMAKPNIAQKAPFPVQVEEGKSYSWCTCGKSEKQPFCDGAHKGTDFLPLRYKAAETTKVFFCGCKHGKNGALCDGSHSKL